MGLCPDGRGSRRCRRHPGLGRRAERLYCLLEAWPHRTVPWRQLLLLAAPPRHLLAPPRCASLVPL